MKIGREKTHSNTHDVNYIHKNVVQMKENFNKRMLNILRESKEGRENKKNQFFVFIRLYFHRCVCSCIFNNAVCMCVCLCLVSGRLVHLVTWCEFSIFRSQCCQRYGNAHTYDPFARAHTRSLVTACCIFI